MGLIEARGGALGETCVRNFRNARPDLAHLNGLGCEMCLSLFFFFKAVMMGSLKKTFREQHCSSIGGLCVPPKNKYVNSNPSFSFKFVVIIHESPFQRYIDYETR